MRKLLLLPLLLLSLVSSFAQTPVTITGTITDSSNNVATGGYIQFVITPTNQSLPYSVLPSTVVAMVSKCAIDATGQPVDFVTPTDPCVVWPNDLISPANSLYQIIIAPNNRVTRTYNNVLIKSTVNPQPLASLTFISPQPVIGTIINGSPLVTMSVIPGIDSVWTVGDPQHYYAAGYFKNLNVSGSLSCVGCTTTILKTNTVLNPVQSTLDFTDGTGIHFSSGALGVESAALTDTAVTPGSYSLASITVDQQGRITAAANGTGFISGSGTAGIFPILSGATSVADSSLSKVTGPPAGVNYSIGGGQSWQLDASNLLWNTGVAGSSSILIANTYAPAANNNAGGINLRGGLATGSACAGSANLLGGGTNSLSNGSTISAFGGCSNGFGAIGGVITLQAGSTAASNSGGDINIIPGTGGFSNGRVLIGGTGAQAPMLMAAGGNRFVTVQAPAGLSSNWTFTWPTSGGTTGQALTTNGSGVTSWTTLTRVYACGTTTTCSATLQATPIVAHGTVTLTAGTATVASLPTYTSTSSFDCTASDITTSSSSAFAVPASTSSITVTGNAADVIAYTCVGN